jgi:hypothetical protein
MYLRFQYKFKRFVGGSQPATGLRTGARIAMGPLRGLSVTWTLAVNRERAQATAVRALAAVIRSQAGSLLKDGIWKKPSKAE